MDNCREAFEKICRENDVATGRLPDYPDQYLIYDTQLRWMGFQSAWEILSNKHTEMGLEIDSHGIAWPKENPTQNTDKK